MIITLLVHDLSFSLFNQIYQRCKSKMNSVWFSRGRGRCRALLDKFHVICREHPEMSVRTVPSPPAFINHLDAGDDVIWVKRDLRVISSLVVVQSPGTDTTIISRLIRVLLLHLCWFLIHGVLFHHRLILWLLFFYGHFIVISDCFYIWDMNENKAEKLFATGPVRAQLLHKVVLTISGLTDSNMGLMKRMWQGDGTMQQNIWQELIMCVCESHLHTLARVLARVPHNEIWVVPQNWVLLKTHTHTYMRGNTHAW